MVDERCGIIFTFSYGKCQKALSSLSFFGVNSCFCFLSQELELHSGGLRFLLLVIIFFLSLLKKREKRINMRLILYVNVEGEYQLLAKFSQIKCEISFSGVLINVMVYACWNMSWFHLLTLVKEFIFYCKFSKILKNLCLNIHILLFVYKNIFSTK